jgi:hypothetical protein
MFRSSKLLRVVLISICMSAGAFAFVFQSWSITTKRLNDARSMGVFPSPAEGMLTLVRSEYIGIQEARIVGAGQEVFLPHVWFVTACVWANSRADGSPVGSPTHDFDYPGYFFVDTQEGWLMMPESSVPLLVGFWMPVFDLAGSDIAQPFHDPSAESKRPCVRQGG